MLYHRLIRLLSGIPSGDPASFFANLPVLETKDLLLRPIRMKDAEDIFAFASDPEVARYVLWDPHRSLSDTRNYIRYLRAQYRRGEPSSWGIVDRASGHVIGTIGLMYFSRVHRSCEIGYSLSRAYWNRGYATQALHAVIACVFEHLPDLQRIEAQHDVRNPASGKVMEKCGMLREGILRSRLMNKNELIDVALYSILRSDPVV